MVAKISSTANLGGALGYNFKKVSAGKAGILLASGISLKPDGTTSMERTLEDMQLMIPSVMRTRKPVFHVSLNPHPDDRLTDGELAKIASYYMEQLGYGNQPYIVFKHSDIEREHIHIVSLRVNHEGKKINDSFEHRRSKRITCEIEKMWQLVPSDGIGQKQGKEAGKPDVAAGNVKGRIAHTVSAILKGYRFQSLGELNAVLAGYNIVAEEVGKESGNRQYKGIVYFVTDKKGKKKTVPIDAGELGRGFGYNALKKSMEACRLDFAPYRGNLRKAVRLAMRENPDKREFVRLMKKMQVSVILRENEDGRIYGITFIDENNKVVANGSRLGKGYSASFFNEYFNGSGENPFMRIWRQSELEGSDVQGDDLIAGITEGLADMPSAPGIDYKEMAFQKKMRKLHSGKTKRKR